MVFERKQEIHRLKFTDNKKNISLPTNVMTSLVEYKREI